MWKLLALIAVALAASGCSDGCVDREIRSEEAPGGLKRAVMFERSCGATTGFSTQLSVLEKGEALTGGGNVIVADDNHGAARTGAWGGPWAEFKWIAPGHLLVRYVARARVLSKASSVKSVDVKFEEVQP